MLEPFGLPTAGSDATHGRGATEAGSGPSSGEWTFLDAEKNQSGRIPCSPGGFVRQQPNAPPPSVLRTKQVIRMSAARYVTYTTKFPYHLQSRVALGLSKPSQLRRTSPTPQTNPRLWSLIISGRGGRRTIHGVVQVDGHGIGETRGGEIDNEGVRRISGWRRNTGAMSGGRRSNSFSVSHKGGDTRQAPHGRGARV